MGLKAERGDFCHGSSRRVVNIWWCITGSCFVGCFVAGRRYHGDNCVGLLQIKGLAVRKMFEIGGFIAVFGSGVK